MKHTLTILIHGESGVGKSTTADTCPGPRLILDAEGRAKYTPSGPKVLWNPMTEAPPKYDGTWNTCVVSVTDFDVVDQVYVWLRSGQHPFVSVVVDSLMEMQKRAIDKIAGMQQMKTQDWGELLRRLEGQVRTFRDLTMIEDNPIQVVVFIVGSVMGEDGKQRPLLQGALKNTVPYYIDVVGYLFTQIDTETGSLVHRMLLRPEPGFVAKDGTGKLPPVIDIPKPARGQLAISNMLDTLAAAGKAESIPAYNPEGVATA